MERIQRRSELLLTTICAGASAVSLLKLSCSRGGRRLAARATCTFTAYAHSVASKYVEVVSHLHPQLLALALKLVFAEPSAQWRTVETIQAFLLLVIWGRRGQDLDNHTLWSV